MAIDITSGFDMLVQVSETAINNILASRFMFGKGFPQSLTLPVNAGGVEGMANLYFKTPVVDLDRTPPQVGLTVRFADSKLMITSPMAATLDLDGHLTIVDSIEMITEGMAQIARIDFTSGAPTVTVNFNDETTKSISFVLIAAKLPQTVRDVEVMMARLVLQKLQTDIKSFDLSPPIPVSDDEDPITPFNIEVTTVNDTTAADHDCVTFGLRMASDSGGDLNGVTSSFIPDGSEAIITMSNDWLLLRVIRPRLAAALGVLETDFDPPLRLNHAVPAPGGEGTLTKLEARVDGNRIRVDGQATDSGTGWSAVSNFSFFIDIGVSEGNITVTATRPSVDTDIDWAPWVWVLSIGVGTLFLYITGAILAAIVLAIVQAVAEGILSNLISGGLGGALGGLPTIPLPIDADFKLATVILDDLELGGSLELSPGSVPEKSRAVLSSLAGFTLDLDSGNIRDDVIPASDLIWNPSTGLSTNGATGLTITGGTFGALTPVQISRLPLTTHDIPLSVIPLTSPKSSLDHDQIVFGVRTTDGRYAKVRAWRNQQEEGALNLKWVTFDNPIPQLDIAARWSVLEWGPLSEYITQDFSVARSSPVRWSGVFEAWPRLMAFPVDYQWCLCGTVLKEGSGSVPSTHGPLAYKLAGRRLSIETVMARGVECELCVSAIDARNQELFTCIQLSKSGSETRGKRWDPNLSKVNVEIIPADPAIASWRPLIAAIPPIASIVTVPDVRQRRLGKARKILRKASLTVGSVTEQATPGVMPGTVVFQQPGAGMLVAEGTAINLIVAAVPVTIVVPNVVGLTLSGATKAINAAGLQVGVVDKQRSTAAADTVLQQNPGAGLQVTPETLVILTVSAPDESVLVPDVIGLTLVKATKRISAAGLSIGQVQKQQSKGAPGCVLTQSPTGGAKAAPASAVDLVIDEG